MMRGGKREGSGRPAAPPTVLVRLRLPVPLHAAWLELGAEYWLRRVLAEKAADTKKDKP